MAGTSFKGTGFSANGSMLQVPARPLHGLITKKAEETTKELLDSTLKKENWMVTV